MAKIKKKRRKKLHVPSVDEKWILIYFWWECKIAQLFGKQLGSLASKICTYPVSQSFHVQVFTKK